MLINEHLLLNLLVLVLLLEDHCLTVYMLDSAQKTAAGTHTTNDSNAIPHGTNCETAIGILSFWAASPTAHQPCMLRNVGGG